MDNYLMSLDAGTGSIRAVIFDLAGNQIAHGQAEWQHLAVPGVPGSMEFDLSRNWQLACQCIRQALQRAGLTAQAIRAVACCSMREGIVLYDRNGVPIWACANVDARASHEVSELKELHNHGFEREVYQYSGQTLALSAMPRLLWLAHHRPDIYRQAATLTMISDWLANMLSGELAVDPSNAGTTGMLDLTSRDWRPALLDMAGLRADILSPVKETGSVLGRVTEQAAQESGLLRGTPVVMGGGDVQLGSLGLGIVRAGQTAVLGGTFWQQIVNLPEPAIDPEMNIRINPHVIPGMAQAESISFFTGLTMRWFRDAFCAEEKLLAERLGVDAYSLLEEMAARVPPGAYGVMPIFSDAMHFKTWYHAAPSFINMSIDPERCNKHDAVPRDGGERRHRLRLQSGADRRLLRRAGALAGVRRRRGQGQTVEPDPQRRHRFGGAGAGGERGHRAGLRDRRRRRRRAVRVAGRNRRAPGALGTRTPAGHDPPRAVSGTERNLAAGLCRSADAGG